MSETDERHGTEAGYSAHRRSGVPMCDPCRHAHNQRTGAQKRATRKRTKKAMYTEAGYHPNHGLGPGRWVPGHWGVLRWEPVVSDVA